MKCRRLFFILALGSLQMVRAAQTANPSLTTAGHNSFDLSPPPASEVQASKTPPPQITLNGLMTIFGYKSALFKVRTPSGEEKSCLLSQGERDGDVELLLVNMKQNTITVNNHGVIQVIAIFKAPVLPATENSVAANGGVDRRVNDHSKNSGNPDQIPGLEFQSANGQPAAFQSGPQIGAANPQAASSAANGATANNNQNSGGSNSGAPKVDPWWMRGSKLVEQSRAQSAEAVANGKASPLPLTPLTPPGTPANLISSEQMFFDHM